ncbi:hypothetical protein HRbin22_00071 [Candidatus Thermoflexus japonica]|uniref:Uncharacterized protein n=1 Tax=Candidatus Thermoflexus japonica TaxID=2035417 RepID=A0A2H5Y325_9CHLR|nr:hypothetical protein HRbin22_00071 [Candidatus Thermoflexus japonica]
MGAYSETMAMALLAWACALPWIGLFILLWFGWQVALRTGVGLLISLLIICWLICSAFPSRLFRRFKRDVP